MAPDSTKTPILDESGKPRVFYHGTGKEYNEFSASEGESIGFHFGCLEQAKHFAEKAVSEQQPNPRIISAYLFGNNLFEFRGDGGWQDCPEYTAKVLAVSACMGGMSGLAAKLNKLFPVKVNKREKQDKLIRQEKNKRIVDCLESEGFDGIKYTNTNEPPDGKGREAYLVFRKEQIIMLEDHKEHFNSNLL